MDELVVTTVVYCPQSDVYEFLVDFPGYARYSKYLRDVREAGGSGDRDGRRYELEFSWWKLTYVARSEVTEFVAPERIEWRVVSDLDAQGRWRIEELDELPADAPADATVATRVTFEVEFDPHSAHEGMLDLPMFVSLDWVIDRAKPLVESEARRVVKRAVVDLEGRKRSVDLRVRTE